MLGSPSTPLVLVGVNASSPPGLRSCFASQPSLLASYSGF